MKYVNEITLEANLREFADKTHVLHSPEATEFLCRAAEVAKEMATLFSMLTTTSPVIVESTPESSEEWPNKWLDLRYDVDKTLECNLQKLLNYGVFEPKVAAFIRQAKLASAGLDCGLTSVLEECSTTEETESIVELLSINQDTNTAVEELTKLVKSNLNKGSIFDYHDDDMEEAAIAMGKDLLAINGTQHQMGQLGCELSELSIALYQHYQQGSKSIDVVANELADLLNMLPQLILVMEEQGVMDLVRSYQKMKLERIRHRTKQKMQEGNYAD